MDNLNLKKKEQELNKLKRTIHHLIKKGAMLESFFDIKDLTVEETEKLLKELAPIVKKIRSQSN